MVSKTAFLCISALLVQTITANCIGNPGAGYGLSGNGILSNNALNNNYNGLNQALSNGGGLQVTSSSPFAPTGIQVLTEVSLEGPLQVTGNLPLLGAVALEGAIPTGGQAGASYGCGNGNVAIVSELGNGGNAGLNNYNAVNGLANDGLANARLANYNAVNGLANDALANARFSNAGLANGALNLGQNGLSANGLNLNNGLGGNRIL